MAPVLKGEIMRLIDADALLKHMEKDPLFPLVERYGISGVIEAQPTIDADPVRHGQWEHLWDSENGTYKGRCTNCGFIHFFIDGHDAQYQYCPNCGAKMDYDEWLASKDR